MNGGDWDALGKVDVEEVLLPNEKFEDDGNGDEKVGVTEWKGAAVGEGIWNIEVGPSVG